MNTHFPYVDAHAQARDVRTQPRDLSQGTRPAIRPEGTKDCESLAADRFATYLDWHDCLFARRKRLQIELAARRPQSFVPSATTTRRPGVFRQRRNIVAPYEGYYHNIIPQG
jgi:hypothetical protein